MQHFLQANYYMNALIITVIDNKGCSKNKLRSKFEGLYYIELSLFNDFRNSVRKTKTRDTMYQGIHVFYHVILVIFASNSPWLYARCSGGLMS